LLINWGLGIGDWGLGSGDWAQSPIPNPQSPIPNPQSPFLTKKVFIFFLNFIYNYKNNILTIMIKKEIKLKRIRKINHQTEKENSLIYPTLNKKYKINNPNDFIKSNINTTFKRKINTKNNYIRTSSAFLKRNYHNYLSKIMQKNSSMNGVMFRKNQLDSLLYKLKKYSNELQTYNDHKLQKLNLLKDTLKQNELKLNKLLELQDIELPDEKISIKNFNEIKLSKEDIENKIYKLIEEKEKIDYSLKNEEEYNRTVEYM